MTDRWKNLRVEHPGSAQLANVTFTDGGSDEITYDGATLVVWGDSNASLKLPPSTPAPANSSAVPPNVKATGNPASKITMTATKSKAATHSMSVVPQGVNAS